MSSIDADKLTSFILSAQVGVLMTQYWVLFKSFIQDPEGGGISDRPGNMVDVFHTHFGIAGMIQFDNGWCVPFLIRAITRTFNSGIS